MVIPAVTHYHRRTMFAQFRKRSLELEHLDKGDYTAAEYEGCIVELQKVNRWLGDSQALKDSLLKEIERVNLQSFSVIDVGAGELAEQSAANVVEFKGDNELPAVLIALQRRVLKPPVAPRFAVSHRLIGSGPRQRIKLIAPRQR